MRINSSALNYIVFLLIIGCMMFVVVGVIESVNFGAQSASYCRDGLIYKQYLYFELALQRSSQPIQ